MANITQYCAEPYKNLFHTIKPTPRVPRECIENALCKIIGTQKPITGQDVQGRDGYIYHYYVTQYTDRSHYPWYQISQNQWNTLNNSNDDNNASKKKVICLFFKQKDNASNNKPGTYNVWYRIWGLNEIAKLEDQALVVQHPWTDSTSNGSPSFRWNPSEAYEKPNLNPNTNIENPNYMTGGNTV